MVVTFQGDPWTAYTVQVSSNLTDWQDLTVLLGTANGFHSLTNFPSGKTFYRTVVNHSPSQIVTTIDASSPPARQVLISKVSPTVNVALGVFDIKSVGENATLRRLSITINTAGGTPDQNDIDQLFTNVKIKVGSLVYSSDRIPVLTTSGEVVFSNLNIPLPSDTYVPVTVFGDVTQDTGGILNGISATITLVSSGTPGGTSNNPYVEDANFNSIGVSSAVLSCNSVTFSDP